MIKLLIETQTGDSITIGHVSSLGIAELVIEALDARFSKWEDAGFPDISDPLLLHWEGSDVMAVTSGPRPEDAKMLLHTMDTWEEI